MSTSPAAAGPANSKTAKNRAKLFIGLPPPAVRPRSELEKPLLKHILPEDATLE
jgi:hypothetical protein